MLVKRAIGSGLCGLLVTCALAALLDAPRLRADQTVQVGPGTVFSPATVTVSPGEAVIWNFNEFHTSTSDTASGPEVWDSGFLSSGTFSHAFTTPGTYPYYCAVHSFPGGTAMNGVVQVVGGGVTPTPTPIPPTTTPQETATPVSSGTPIPALGSSGRMLFALALAAAGLAALFLSGRR